jgi:hypothetical protein
MVKKRLLDGNTGTESWRWQSFPGRQKAETFPVEQKHPGTEIKEPGLGDSLTGLSVLAVGDKGKR